MFGYLQGDATLVARGMLCEIGWEVKDVLCLCEPPTPPRSRTDSWPVGGFFPYVRSCELSP